MNLGEFQLSITNKQKPIELSADLEALWEDAVGNWEGSHDLAQEATTPNGDRIHAYLHRKEGDQFNAGYWYRRCGIQMPKQSLEEEWKELVVTFLDK